MKKRSERNSRLKSQAISLLAGALVTVSSFTVHAQTLQCSDLFTPKTAQTQSGRTSTSLLRELFTFKRRESFSDQRFQKELALYKHALKNGVNVVVRVPQTPEAKLALLEAIGEHQGHGLDRMTEALRTASPEGREALAKMVNGLNFEKSMGPASIEKAFAKLYVISHADPRLWANLSKSTIPDTLTAIIRERAEIELGSHSLLAALDSLGFIRDPAARDRISRFIATHPTQIDLAHNMAINAFSYALTGLPITTPEFRTLAGKPIPPALREKAMKQGFDSIEKDLAALYGKRPQFDLAWHYARKVLNAGLMAIVISQVAPMMLHNLIPPDVNPEDDSYLSILESIVRYWTDVARGALLKDDGSETAIIPDDQASKELLDLRQLLKDLKTEEYGGPVEPDSSVPPVF